MAKRPAKKRSTRTQKEKAEALTLLRQRFVLALVGEAKGNGAEAARLAGFKAKTPHGYAVIASELMTIPDIQGAVQAARAKLEAEGMETAVELQTFLTRAVRAANAKLDIEEITADHVEAYGALWHVGMTASAQLVKIQGLAAPKKHQHAGAVSVVNMSDEHAAAIDQWLEYREDPVIKARVAELDAERRGPV